MLIIYIHIAKRDAVIGTFKNNNNNGASGGANGQNVGGNKKKRKQKKRKTPKKVGRKTQNVGGNRQNVVNERDLMHIDEDNKGNNTSSGEDSSEMDLTNAALKLFQTGEEEFGTQSIERRLPMETVDAIVGGTKVTGKRLRKSKVVKKKKISKAALMKKKEKRKHQLSLIKNETNNTTSTVNNNNHITINILGSDGTAMNNLPHLLNMLNTNKNNDNNENVTQTQQNVLPSTENVSSQIQNVTAQPQNESKQQENVSQSVNRSNTNNSPEITILPSSNNVNNEEKKQDVDPGFDGVFDDGDESEYIPDDEESRCNLEGCEGIDYWICNMCTLKNSLRRKKCFCCKSS